MRICPACGCSTDTEEQLGKLRAENARLTGLLNTPETEDFIKAVQLEAGHQRERWGSEHDEGKTGPDWFWLIGYLAGKALHSAVLWQTAKEINDRSTPNAAADELADRHFEKLKHHIITTAAACANWHLQILGKSNMRPGIATPQGEEEAQKTCLFSGDGGCKNPPLDGRIFCAKHSNYLTGG
jgi:hypothetical protein